jgi:hypothetical protein
MRAAATCARCAAGRLAAGPSGRRRVGTEGARRQGQAALGLRRSAEGRLPGGLAPRGGGGGGAGRRLEPHGRPHDCKRDLQGRLGRRIAGAQPRRRRAAGDGRSRVGLRRPQVVNFSLCKPCAPLLLAARRWGSPLAGHCAAWEERRQAGAPCCIAEMRIVCVAAKQGTSILLFKRCPPPPQRGNARKCCGSLLSE